MKKQHTKKIRILGLLCLFLIGRFFTGCEAEKDFATAGNTNKHEITFEQFKRETGLHDFKTKIHVNGVHQTNQSLAKLADGSYELSDFDVSTEFIKKIEESDRKSYTFRVYPRDPELALSTNSIFNLNLYRKEGQDWETSIIEFKPTPINLERIKEELTERVEGKAKLLYKGNLTTYGIASGGDCVEIEIISYHCSNPGNCLGEGGSCDFCNWCVSYDYVSFCIDGGAGVSDGGFNNGFGTSTGTGVGIGGLGDGDGVPIMPYTPNPSNSNDPRPMIPNVKDTSDEGHTFQNDNITPCEQLKSFSKTENDNPKIPNLKAKIDEVKDYAGDFINSEVIYNFSKDYSGNYATDNLTVAPVGNSAPTKPKDDFYGAIHSHTWKLYPMFTWSDVNVLRNYYYEAKPYNRSEVTLLLAAKECLTCTEVLVYALKIKDWNTFRAKIANDLFNNPRTEGLDIKEKIKYKDEQFFKKFTLDMNNQDLEKLFLENFADYGIDIYKANNDELTEWNKLELSGNPIAPIKKTPCN